MDKFIIFPKIEGTKANMHASALVVDQIESCTTDGTKGYITTANRSASVKETDVELIALALSQVKKMDNFDVFHWDDLVSQILESSEHFKKEAEAASFGGLLEKEQGLILFVGGTGSGKTHVLGEAVRELATRGRSVFVMASAREPALDPIKFESGGSVSLTFWDDTAKDFAKQNSFALRADPDGLVYDELRTAEHITAALNAALSGCLVLATIHAKDLEQAKHTILNRYLYGEKRDSKELVLKSTLAGVVECKRAVGDDREFTADAFLV